MMSDKVNYEKSSGNKLFLLGFIYKLLIVDIKLMTLGLQSRHLSQYQTE